MADLGYIYTVCQGLLVDIVIGHDCIWQWKSRGLNAHALRISDFRMQP